MQMEPIIRSKDFRTRALLKLVLGLLGSLLTAGILLALSSAGYMPVGPFSLIPPSIPFVYFCIGVIELVTGRPFQQLADAWMGLKGWQRGILGTLIVLVAGFLISMVVFALAMWLA